MSHLNEFKSDVISPDGRHLGDEWADWDGEGGGTIRTGKGLFIVTSVVVMVLSYLFLGTLTYLITPRLESWALWLVPLAWITFVSYVVISLCSTALVILTVLTEKRLLPENNIPYLFFDFVFSRVFKLASILKISRDKMGHSFVCVSNALSKALKQTQQEKLLILLPRCLAKDELKAVNELKEKYHFDVHVVSGGELARKKVAELKPTAVIGIACERDLVSGIRDVGRKISVIGIPNERPEGPCRNTHINMAELISAIEFYLGPKHDAGS